MNPIQFIPELFMTDKFTHQEKISITEIKEKFEDCRFFLKICSVLKLIDVGTLSLKVHASLGEIEKESVMKIQKNYYDEVFDIYFRNIEVSC